MYVGVTNKSYDLDQPQERFRLREDLENRGFFTVAENKKYWETFDKEHVRKTELAGLMTAFKWFEITVQKVPMPKN